MLPLLAILAVGLAWLVALGVTQARAQDAAREAARVVARGESVAQGAAQASRVAGAGSTSRIARSDREVRVSIGVPVRGPGGLFAFIPAYVVHAHAVAATEGASP